MARELENAIFFVVPGQRALMHALEGCTLDGGRSFAAAFTWLLAVIYLGSAVSRLKLQAGLIRLEAGEHPQAIGPTLRAFLFGIVAVVGIQFLFVGSAYPWLNCSAFADIDRGGPDRTRAPDAGLSAGGGLGLAAGRRSGKYQVETMSYIGNKAEHLFAGGGGRGRPL